MGRPCDAPSSALRAGRKLSDELPSRYAAGIIALGIGGSQSALGRKVSDEFTFLYARGHHRESHRRGGRIQLLNEPGTTESLIIGAALVSSVTMAEGERADRSCSVPSEAGAPAAKIAG